MDSNAIRRIIIAGGGIAGWTAAAGIAHALRGQGIEITVLEDPNRSDDETRGAEATLPISHAFHQRLGVNEQQLMGETDATFSLGTEFRDWTVPGNGYFQPLGAHGASIEFVQFHNYATKARQQGDRGEFNDYSLCAVAARQGKFAHPVNDPNSVLSTLMYAHHLDTGLYTEFIARLAMASGARRETAEISGIEVDGESGFIQALRLGDGRSLEADIYVDCTGQESRLLGGALGVGRTDWSHWLPANRMIIASGTDADPPPCTVVTGLEDAWHHEIPLRRRRIHRLVFNSGRLDDETALDRLSQAAGHALEGESDFIGFASGRRDKFWSGNCVALGAAAGHMEPLSGTHTALLHAGLMRLLSMFPDKSCSPLLAEEYNEVTAAEYENVRDYLVLHYRAGALRVAPFWQDYLAQEVPASLAHKIRLFNEHGQVAFYDEESFPETNWASVWLGQDCWPKGYDPILDNYDFPRLQARFAQMKDIIAQTAAGMPSHSEYLARYCG